MERDSILRTGLVLVVIVATGLTMSSVGAVWATTTYWQVTTGNWNVPSNWTGGVPSAGDDAYVNNGGTANVTSSVGSCRGLTLGAGNGESGTVDISGGSLTVNEHLFIGDQGQGIFYIRDGAVFSNPASMGGLFIGYEAAGVGSVFVSGAGSIWSRSGSLEMRVGQGGQGCVRIEDGGEISGGSASIGTDSTGTGHVTVTGTGSTWNNGGLWVAELGVGELTIGDGGAVLTDYTEIGGVPGGNGTVTVTGSGSALRHSQYLSVGGVSTGTLTVADSAEVSMEWASGIGGSSGSSGTVTVAGGGSDFTCEQDFFVGLEGTGTFIQTGGTTAIAGSLYVGYGFGSNGAYTISDGALSVASLFVGAGGDGALDITGAAAEITVSNVLSFGPNSAFAAVPGAAVHMTGAHFENLSISETQMAGLANLEMVFEGGTEDTDDFEVGCEDKGVVEEGFAENFALGKLTLGGADIGLVRLVDNADNGNRGGTGGNAEALYVDRLELGAGSILDLNNFHLYWRTEFVDKGGTILNGEIMHVEPTGLVFHPTDDAYIWMEYPDENRGSHDDMHVRNIDGAGPVDNWEKDALVKFDLSSILPGSVIGSATLHLYYHYCSFGNCAGRDLNCRRITSSWDEATVTWNTRPSIAAVVTDHSVVPSSFGWMDWDVTGDVQAMVDEEVDNEGWQIADEVPWGWSDIPDSRFRTKEYGDYIPYLEITITSEDWPMFHHDLAHTGYSPSTAPDTNNILWSYSTGAFVQESPAVVDGRLYVTFYHRVRCLDAATGDSIWNYTAGDYVNTSPAVVDGKVYVGSNDDNVYCLNAETGDYIWSYTAGDNVLSDPVVTDGRVFVGSNDHNVYCLDAANGDFIWSFTTGDFVWTSPAVSNGKVYVGSDDANVYCLPQNDPNEDGVIAPDEVIWSYTTLGRVRSTPAVANGRVYVGSARALWGNMVYCLDASAGGSIWTYETGHAVSSSPAVAYGKVYFAVSDTVCCLDAEGNGDGTTDMVWGYEIEGYDVTNSPAVADGKVYVGADWFDRRIYCLDAETGDSIWTYRTGDQVRSSPAIADGRVYIGSHDMNVYCFGAPREDPVPDPSRSYVEWRDRVGADTKPFVCPCGGGSWLYVSVMDQYNAPMDSVVVTPSFSAGCDMCQCEPLTAVTDSNGVAEFHIQAGLDVSGDTACCVVEATVTCLGVTIPWKDTGGALADTSQWLSPDMDGDCDVDDQDFAIFSVDYMAGQGCRSDYDCDGVVQMADYAIFAPHNTHTCEPVAGIGGEPESQRLISTLAHNYPNPFSVSTRIAFSIEKPGRVVLRIYDAAGRRVRTLLDGRREAKRYAVNWDGRDDRGNRVAAGVYFYRLEAPGWAAVKKMTLAR